MGEPQGGVKRWDPEGDCYAMCVFPLPGSPVKKTFAPVCKILSAVSCVMGIEDHSGYVPVDVRQYDTRF